MLFTVIATEARHSYGDAYSERTYTTFKVLGTVDAPDATQAIKAMETKLKGDQKQFSGDVIVMPGVVDKVVEGYIST